MSFTKRLSGGEGGSDCWETPRQKKVRVFEDQVGRSDELEVQIVGFKLGSIEKGADREKRELGNLGSSQLMVDHVLKESLDLDLNGENLEFDLNFPAMEEVGKEIIHISSDESDGEDVCIIDENDARRKGKEIDNGFVDESIERLDIGLVTMELGTTSNGCGERRYTREEKGKAKIDDSWLSLGTKLMDSDLLPKNNHELINSANSGGVQIYEYNYPEETIQLEVTEDLEVERERNTTIARSRQRAKTIRNREILRRHAPQLAHFNPQQEQDQERQQQSIETEKKIENFMGPFSTAMNLVKERNLKHSSAQQLINWQPLKYRDRNISLPMVPSLLDLSMKVLAKNADAIVSLEHVPDALKHRLTSMLCDSRKMNIHGLELLLKASPTEIRIKDCSWITEEQFTKEFGSFDPKNLKVLQLDLCGQCVLGDSLCKTLARSPNSLPDLAIISLKGACRLTALKELVASAPLLQSINLGQCSLLTYTSIDILADSLGAILRELYIDNCQQIDAMLITPALKKFKHLEVLSVAGIQTVCDEFLIDVIAVCGQNIKELNVADCLKLTDISLEVIGNTCSGLCSLNISNLHKLTDLSIQYLANGCQSIQTLKLQQNSFSDEAIAAFLEVSGKPLKQLSLNKVTKVGANTALSLAKCSKELVSLDLSWCRKITNEALGLIVDSCLSLKLLKLFGCTQIDNEFLNGHSNSLVRIIGLNMTLVLEHFNLLEHEEALLRYSPLAFSSDSQSSDHPDI